MSDDVIQGHAQHVERLFDKFGYNPIIELIDMAQDPGEMDPADRMKLHSMLAKFRYPQLKAVETNKALDTKIVVNIANMGTFGGARNEFKQTVQGFAEDSDTKISSSLVSKDSTQKG